MVLFITLLQGGPACVYKIMKSLFLFPIREVWTYLFVCFFFFVLLQSTGGEALPSQANGDVPLDGVAFSRLD